ncbi:MULTISPECIES: hypothetical protein [unclassified Microbacterium]|uniref:hypothetical protein n=1 Tax=unclassified Microbacterium TaxID=2609290 RepID=UPI000493A77F|nr:MULTISPECIES: hypothetical protein [unclassified Microbacterium]
MTSAPTVTAARSTLRLWFAMVPLLLGILIGALAISSVSTALPAIRGELALSDTEGLWLARRLRTLARSDAHPRGADRRRLRAEADRADRPRRIRGA